jgi:EAL domain-containing protein (putative c-di-GMP-specific phosphodiesterase class I)
MSIEPLFDSLIPHTKLVLLRQPITDASKDVMGNEVLLRILDRSGAVLLPPATLIKALTALNVQPHLDQRIINMALTQAEDGQAPPSALRLFINISPTSLLRLPEWLRDINPAVLATLCFEITEDEAIPIKPADLDAISYIRDLGVCFALDDFGSCYLSYDEFFAIKPRYVKVNADFIARSFTTPFYAEVIRGIASLAAALPTPCQLIGEGIESEALFEHARALGVTLFQGWHLGLPA